MPYSSNMVINGQAANLNNWTSTNVAIKTGSSNYFELNTTGNMRQDILFTDINTSAREYKISIDFMYLVPRPVGATSIKAYARIDILYNDNTKDNFLFPFLEDNLAYVVQPEGIWYHIDRSLFTRTNSILNKITVSVYTKDAPCKVGVDNISLVRNITDMESHMSTTSPHNLPLAITVGDFGIKGTKNNSVKFWLKDDGDADFGGNLTAATGTFRGTVYAQNINTSEAKITTAQIENLVVGSNVTMGPNASISWGQITNQPTIPTQYTDAMALAKINSTYLDANGVWTPFVYANRLYGTAIVGKTLENASGMTKSFIDESGIHLYNKDTSGTTQIQKLQLTTNYDFDHEGTIIFTNNNYNTALIEFTASDFRLYSGALPILLQSSAGINMRGNVTVNGSSVSIVGHRHDELYSLLSHNHDTMYSLLGHNHNGVYATSSHTHSQYLYAQAYGGYLEFYNEYGYVGRCALG